MKVDRRVPDEPTEQFHSLLALLLQYQECYCPECLKKADQTACSLLSDADVH